MRRKIFKNARIVDVIQKKIYKGWFSVLEGNFEFVEKGDYKDELDGEVMDLKGLYAIPGFIDSHMHIESSLVTPKVFSQAVIPHGTVAVLQDPHEMANVFGKKGVEFMIENALGQPLEIYTAIPSCVPTTRKHLETSNAEITPDDVRELSEKEGVIALGEVMDYNGVLEGDERLLKILSIARERNLSIEGHCPTLRGRDLSSYLYHGIRSDHTLTNPNKMEEQLRKGMYVMIQRKSLTEENIRFIMGLKDRSRILMVTDDFLPSDLAVGHLNLLVNLAISKGWDPLDAISSVTIRPAVYLGLRHLGAISPGKKASFFISESIEEIKPLEVFVKGSPYTSSMLKDTRNFEEFSNSINLRKLRKEDFRVYKKEYHGHLEVNVISVDNTENTLTTLSKRILRFENGYPVIDASKDISIIAVFKRKEVVPKGCVGFIENIGLRKGAFATTFSHDSHNILVIGKEIESMVKAVNSVIEAKGGMSIFIDGKVHLLELPIGGLITDEPFERVLYKFQKMESKLRDAGVRHREPVKLFSVLALTVSPFYKMSDLGIVDVEEGRLLPVVVGEAGQKI